MARQLAGRSSAGMPAPSTRRRSSDDPFYGVKIDGYITDRPPPGVHLLRHDRRDAPRLRRYNDVTDTIGAAAPNRPPPQGGDNWVARYTGTFTDWLTLSAAYGVSENRTTTRPCDHQSSSIAAGCFATVDANGVGPSPRLNAPGFVRAPRRRPAATSRAPSESLPRRRRHLRSTSSAITTSASASTTSRHDAEPRQRSERRS